MGKTTCAAALAIRTARSRRTLLISTDPASSLGDVLQMPVGRRPRPVTDVAGLYAANLDAAAAFQTWFADRRGTIAAIALRGSYLDEEDVARLLGLSLPGADEIIALLGLVRLAARGGYECLVVDTAPTGHTLRLLTAPALLARIAFVLEALQAHHRDVVLALRGRYDEDRGDALIGELLGEGRALETLLRDEERTQLWWVALPEPMALEETADAFAALRSQGIRPANLIVNRVTPPAACAWCQGRRRVEARAMAPVLRRLHGVGLRVVPDWPSEPRGRAALSRIARSMTSTARVRGGAGPLPRRISAELAPGLRRNGNVRAASLVPPQVRLVLFGGKGGVGKSTCAAACAVDAARSSPSRRVLLLSTDPAHSLADVFGTPLDDAPAVVDAALTNLHAREIDAEATLADFRSQYVASVDAVFGALSRGTSGLADRTVLRQLLDIAPPGIDEVIAITDVAEALADSRRFYDTIIVDTAPTGHALRLLQTPALLRDWTQALMAILLKYREVVAAGALAALLVGLSQRLRGLMTLMRDSTRTQLVIVTRAAALPMAESRRFSSALRALGISVGGVVVNATGGGTCARCRRRGAAERAQIRQYLRAERTPARPVIAAAATMPPPHGARALGDWSATWIRLR